MIPSCSAHSISVLGIVSPLRFSFQTRTKDPIDAMRQILWFESEMPDSAFEFAIVHIVARVALKLMLEGVAVVPWVERFSEHHVRLNPVKQGAADIFRQLLEITGPIDRQHGCFVDEMHKVLRAHCLRIRPD
jgi:hypothetical protein